MVAVTFRVVHVYLSLVDGADDALAIEKGDPCQRGLPDSGEVVDDEAEDDIHDDKDHRYEEQKLEQGPHAKVFVICSKVNMDQQISDAASCPQRLGEHNKTSK